MEVDAQTLGSIHINGELHPSQSTPPSAIQDFSTSSMTDNTSKGQELPTSQTSKNGIVDTQDSAVTPAEEFEEGEESEEFDESKSDIASLNVQDIQKLMLSSDSLENLAHIASSKDSHPQKAEQARQLFVTTWLLQNYQMEPDYSILRSTIYDQYTAVCKGFRVRPINPASFGKFIRTVFPDIKTRRLGNRGASRYHYCGLRQKVQKHAEVHAPKQKVEPAAISRQTNGTKSVVGSLRRDIKRTDGRKSLSRAIQEAAAAEVAVTAGTSGYYMVQESVVPQSVAGEQLYYVAETSVAHNAANARRFEKPQVPPFNPDHNISGQSLEDLKSFYYGSYERHCRDLLEDFQHVRLNQFQMNVTSFWGKLLDQYKHILSSDSMSDWIWRTDAIMFDSMLRMIHSAITQIIPQSVVQALRAFARSIETWTDIAMSGYSVNLVQKKLDAVRSFSHLLLKVLSVNSAAQAAGKILVDQLHLSRMRDDWQMIHFKDFEESSLWAKSGDPSRDFYFARGFWADLGLYVHSPATIEQLMNWADSILTKYGVDENHEQDRSFLIYSNTQFLFKWQHTTNQLLSDLTQRSAPSFGAFQLVRLFLDEHLTYAVEKRLWKLRMNLLANEPPVGGLSPAILLDKEQSQDGTLSPRGDIEMHL